MTTTLIVLAHPEPRSFSGQWAEATARAAEAAGHKVLRTNLGDFDPVERAAHYAEPGEPFDVLKAQEQASVAGMLPADVEAEIRKLEAADRIVRAGGGGSLAEMIAQAARETLKETA